MARPPYIMGRSAFARSRGRTWPLSAVKSPLRDADMKGDGTNATPTAERPPVVPDEEPGSNPEPAPEPKPNKGLYPPRHPGRSSRMIGEVVVDLGLSDRETVEDAVQAARDQGRPTGLILVERGILRHDQLARVVAERFGLDFVDLTTFDLDMGAVNLISADTARRYQAVPVGFTEDGVVLVAMANPTNVLTIDDIGMMTGRRIRPCAASIEDLDLLLAKLAQMDESIEDIVDEDEEVDAEDLRLAEAEDQAPVIKLVHSIVAQATQQGASDIHINPEEGDTRVLYRVDGVLAPAATIRRKMSASVVSRIKIMADLDISERRVPQDGRFGLTVDGRRVDIRVVTLPLVHGEGVVMRILDTSGSVGEIGRARHAGRGEGALRSARSTAPTGPCWSRDRRARASPPPCTRRCTPSTTANAASSRSRTRSSSGSRASSRCRSRPRRGSPSTSACARCSAPTPT